VRRNGYLWTSSVNLDTAFRFPNPDFLLECKISAIWRRFAVDFCILYAECPPYFYFRFAWPTDPESIPHASTPTSIIPTKFEVDMTIHCQVIAFLSADTLTFDLLTVGLHDGSRDNLTTKFEDPMPIFSWVMSYNVSRWLPLKMRMQPLCMSRGSKTITFLESPTPICLFTIQLLLGHDDN